MIGREEAGRRSATAQALAKAFRRWLQTAAFFVFNLLQSLEGVM